MDTFFSFCAKNCEKVKTFVFEIEHYAQFNLEQI